MDEARRDGEKGGRLWWQARRERALRVRAWRLRTRQPERTAYHEAGHAVMARCMGLGVEYLTIRPDPASNTIGSIRLLGVRRWRPGQRLLKRLPGHRRRRIRKLMKTSPAALRRAKARLLVDVAGSVAEEIRFGPGFASGARSDRRHFHEVAKRLHGRSVPASDDPGGTGYFRVLPGSEILALRRRYTADCHRIFEQPGVWDWVEAVARAALECTTLSGGAIDDLRPEQVSVDPMT